MSTKIYEAYRVKGNVNFWKLIQRIKTKGEATVTEALKALYLDSLQYVIEDSEKYKSELEICVGDEYLAKLAVVRDVFFDLYKACYTRFEGGPYDLTVLIRFYRLGRSIYLIPAVHWLAPTNHCLDFLKKEKGLEEYRYWTNSDKPEGITRKEWVKRGKTWDRVLDRGVLFEMRLLDLFGNFHKIDPWWKLIDDYKKQNSIE